MKCLTQKVDSCCVTKRLCETCFCWFPSLLFWFGRLFFPFFFWQKLCLTTLSWLVLVWFFVAVLCAAHPTELCLMTAAGGKMQVYTEMSFLFYAVFLFFSLPKLVVVTGQQEVVVKTERVVDPLFIVLLFFGSRLYYVRHSKLVVNSSLSPNCSLYCKDRTISLLPMKLNYTL